MELVKKVLVRLYDIDTDTMMRAFFTVETKAILDMYSYAKENDIEVSVPFNDKNNEDKYNHTIAYIKEISMSFGSKESYPTIDIWAEVLNV